MVADNNAANAGLSSSDPYPWASNDVEGQGQGHDHRDDSGRSLSVPDLPGRPPELRHQVSQDAGLISFIISLVLNGCSAALVACRRRCRWPCLLLNHLW